MNLLAQLAPVEPTDWWWGTLTSGPALVLLGVAAVCMGLMVYTAVRLRAVSAGVRRRVPIRQRLADDSGVAMIEFALVTPILLFVTLLLIQTMLVFTGLFYVQYSAFAAARSAITIIPGQFTGSEPPNEMAMRGYKSTGLTLSAALPLMAVSGRESGSDVLLGDVGSQLEQAFTEMYSSLGKPQPNWVNEMLAQRLNYAVNHTVVEVARVFPGDGSQTVVFDGMNSYTTFGPKDAIMITVHHEFALSIPLASRVFTAVSESGTYSPAGRDGDSPGPPGQWSKISARAMLTNEGIDRRLPEAPPVPRR